MSLLRRAKNAVFRSRRLASLIELLAVPLLWFASWLASRRRRPIDVGLGPEPLINNVYHRKALEKAGLSAETFVSNTYYITEEFDFDLRKTWLSKLPAGAKPIALFLRAIFRYQTLLIYMNGGPLGFSRHLKDLEPKLLRRAGVKVIATGYGSDVQVMTRSPNLAFRHAMSIDYPGQGKREARVEANLARWIEADAIISGVEWVDYMPHWTDLMLGHFSIDTERWKPGPPRGTEGPLRVLHAPNHRAIKGTAHLLAAIDRLHAEGHAIELVLLERVPNAEIKAAMEGVDLVADQFVIGWYAMFALEAMALAKPVLCHVRQDLVDLYRKAGLIEADEIPLLDTPVERVEERLRWALCHRNELAAIGARGRAYVEKHHALEVVGARLAAIIRRA